MRTGPAIALLVLLGTLVGLAGADEPAPALPSGRARYADLHPFGIRGPRGSNVFAATREAIHAGLAWLVAHQAPDGSWGAADFRNWCDGKPVEDASRRPDGWGKSAYDVGTTALAVLALQGAGYTHTMPGDHGYAVSAGLAWLRKQQDKEGCVGKPPPLQFVYGHAYAALAFVEAFGMTGDTALLDATQRALDFVALARNPYFAWRYGLKPGDNDTSVTGNMLAAIHAAQKVNRAAIKQGQPAPLTVDESANDGASAWLSKVTDPDYGRVGYVTRGAGPTRVRELVDRFPGEKSEALTAMGMVMRVGMGEDPRKSKIIKLGANICAKLPPTWNPSDGSIDMYYWYYGTLAMFQVGGKHWDIWQRGVDQAIVGSQRRDTVPCRYQGSWDPVGAWGLEGGRVYSTALMLLALETPWRVERLFGSPPHTSGRAEAVEDPGLAPALRARLARGLAHRAPTHADAVLARVVASDSRAIRRAAARAILELPAESAARKALAVRMADDDLLLRVLALAVGAGDADKVLAPALVDGNTDIALAALDEVARRGWMARKLAETIRVPAASKDGTGLALRVAATLAKRRAGVSGDGDAKLARQGLVSSHWATRVRAASLAGLLVGAEPALTAVLIDVLLLDVDERVAVAAAQALGRAKRDDPAVQAALLAASHLRTPVAGEVLKRIGPDERLALKGLVAMLPDKRRRDLAQHAIRRLGPSTTDDLIALLGAGTGAAQSAVVALVGHGAGAVPKLLAAIEHKEAVVRAGVITALGQIDPATAAVVLALVKAAGDKEPFVRNAAGRAIERLGWVKLSADGLPPEAELMAALRHDDAARRMHAVVALTVGGVEVEGAHDALATSMSDPDDDIAERASAALRDLGRKSVPTLVRLLEGGSHASKLRSIAVLRALGKQAAGSEKALVALLADTTVTDPALGALERIGKPAVKPLLAAMRKGRDGLQYEIVQVFGAIGPDAAAATNQVIRYIKTQGVADPIRLKSTRAAFRTLARIGKRAASPLHALLKHDSATMRRLTAEALGTIGSLGSLAPLRGAAKKEYDTKAKIAMLAAIRSLKAR